MATNKNLAWAQAHFAKYNPQYERFDDYYEGEHPLKIVDEVKAEYRQMLSTMRDNLCPKVVNCLADRLVLQNFSSEDERLADWVNEFWTGARLDIDASTVHLEAIEYGDHYVIVWPEPGTDNRPMVYLQDTRNIAVRYGYLGEKQTIIEAVKCWVEVVDDKEILRVTIYTPNSVERYYSHDASSGLPDDTSKLIPYDNGPGEASVWNHNWGVVPVFRFANSMRPGKFARSEIKEAIPIQDLINQAILNLFTASEFYGMPRRWVTGLTIRRDDEGHIVKPFATVKDAIWALPDPNAKLGEFSQADLEKLLAALNDHRHELARVTDTPEHLFMLQQGDPPSGKALETAEAPLTAKVNKRKKVWGAIWGDVLLLCARIAGLNPQAKLDAVWHDTAPRDVKEQVETQLLKLSIGVSKSQALRELGYEQELIEDMAQENAEEARISAENALAAFNAGAGAI